MMVLLTDFCWSNIDQEGSRTFNFQRFPGESLPFQDLTTSTNDTERTIESFQPFIVVKVNTTQFDLMISITFCITYARQANRLGWVRSQLT